VRWIGQSRVRVARSRNRQLSCRCRLRCAICRRLRDAAQAVYALTGPQYSALREI
jgi:hypothetical protein